MKRHKNLRVLARFSPKTVDDLDSELTDLVGTEAVFCYHKYVDDDDSQYSDQWMLTTEDHRFGGYCFPECDLDILQEKQSA